MQVARSVRFSAERVLAEQVFSSNIAFRSVAVSSFTQQQVPVLDNLPVAAVAKPLTLMIPKSP